MVLVPSLGLGFELAVDCLLELEKLRSEPAARATEEAVGAVSELRLAFLRGCWVGAEVGDSALVVRTDFTERGLFGWLAGDLMLPNDGFAGDFVDIEDGLLLGVAFSGVRAALKALPGDFGAGVCDLLSLDCL